MKFQILALCLTRGAAAGIQAVSTVYHRQPFLHPNAHHVPLVAEAHHVDAAGTNTSDTPEVVAPIAAAAPQLADPPVSDIVVAEAAGDAGEGDAAGNALPPVSEMVSAAAGTLKSINSQASILEARIAQAQMEREAKMARQKAIFERRLQQQERTNQDVISANKHISEDIATLTANNEAVKKHTHDLQEMNKAMRLELRTFQSKLHIAGSFITESLKATDDRNAKQLAVLQGGTQGKSYSDEDKEEVDYSGSGVANEAAAASPPKGVSTNDDDDDDDDDADAAPKDARVSLLAVSATTRRSSSTAKSSENAALGQMADVEAQLSNFGLEGSSPQSSASPSDLLTVLSSSVAQLKEQEAAGEKKLQALFINTFKTGAKRHRELLHVQLGLNSTRDSLQAVQTKLKDAEAHLEGTRSNLDQRLRGLGLFLQRLGHVALVPPREAPRLLDALPSAVVAQQAPVAQASP
jgi:hypothetical protein